VGLLKIGSTRGWAGGKRGARGEAPCGGGKTSRYSSPEEEIVHDEMAPGGHPLGNSRRLLRKGNTNPLRV